MKKFIRMIFALVLVLALSLSSFTFTFAQTYAVPRQPIQDDSYQLFETLYARLVSHFGEEFLRNHDIAVETAASIRNSFSETERGDVIYPDYFGGMYIDRFGNLTVLFVGDAFTDTNSITPLNAAGNVRFVEFSYSSLLDTFHTIFYFKVDNWQNEECLIMYNLGSTDVDTINNRVNVYLCDTSPQQIRTFREAVVCHPSLYFIQATVYHRTDSRVSVYEYAAPYEGESDYLYSVTAEPLSTVFIFEGIAITRRATGRNRSLGYFVRHRVSGSRGFVTAMHGSPHPLEIGERFYIGNVRIGTVQAVCPNTDSAFVSLETNNVIVLNQPAILRNERHIPTVGEIAWRISYGSDDSPLSCFGEITTLSHSFSPGGGIGPVTSNRAKFSAATGDSGGFVGTISNSRFRPTGMLLGWNYLYDEAVFVSEFRVRTSHNVEVRCPNA